MDEERRRLERLARIGDLDAARRLHVLHDRLHGPTICRLTICRLVELPDGTRVRELAPLVRPFWSDRDGELPVVPPSSFLESLAQDLHEPRPGEPVGFDPLQQEIDEARSQLNDLAGDPPSGGSPSA